MSHTESLYVKMKGENLPTVTMDDPGVAFVTPEQSIYDEARNVTECWFRVTPQKSGVCTVLCSFNGTTVFTVPIVVP